MRFYIALYISIITNIFSKLFKIGSGYTWPGHLALKFYPNVLMDPHIKFKKGVVLVSGTNGKTTTSKLLKHILTDQTLSVVNNTTGANLLNGIVSTVLLNCGLTGSFDHDIGVFEVDEFALPVVLDYLKADFIILLNLSRDQLDRYGEVDIVFDRWHKKIISLKTDTTLVLYEEQSQFLSLSQDYLGETVFFDGGPEFVSYTKLRGDFNAINVNAASTTASLLKIEKESIKKSLKIFESAYGRGEVLDHKGKNFHLYLAKNPASQNNNLHILFDYDPITTAVLFILNDNIPDGRDVSWIYDIRKDLLHDSVSRYNNVYVSGTRYLDMTVRLKYAGIDLLDENIDGNLARILERISDTNITDVIVLPNYSAMLQIRKELTGKAIL